MADTLSLVVDDAVSPWLAGLPSALRAELLTVADALQRELLARVRAAAGGDVLHVGTGRLLAGLTGDVTPRPDGFTAAVSADAPQAGILEYGGTTAPHDILPTAGRALRFGGGAGEVFAAAVHHPGATFEPRPFMRAPLDAMAPEIVAAQQAAVRRLLEAR